MTDELSEIVNNPYSPPRSNINGNVPSENISDRVLEGIDMGVGLTAVTSFPFINLIGPCMVSYFFPDCDSPFFFGLIADFFAPVITCAAAGAVYGSTRRILGYSQPKMKEK